MLKFLDRTTVTGAALVPIYWAGLGHFALELCHNFMPVLYPLLTLQMGLSFTQIGLLALANNLVTSTFQPFLGFLPERYGDVLEWKYIDGLTVEEIGARLAIGTKAAESCLTRARIAMREAMLALGNEADILSLAGGSTIHD